jgi:hypothetical protein
MALSNWLFADPVEYLTTGAVVVVSMVMFSLIYETSKATAMPTGKNPMFIVNALFTL